MLAMQEDHRTLYPPEYHYQPRISNTTTETFKIRVVFVRTSSSNLKSNLKMVFSPRNSHTTLQINGFEVHPSEKIFTTLNRHRTDSKTSESIFVNTDRIRISGGILQFQLENQGFVLVSGCLRNMNGDNGWKIELNEGGNSGFNEGFMDIYFAGRSKGKALLLNGVLHLRRWKEVDCISDGDEITKTATSSFHNHKDLEKEMKEMEVDGHCELKYKSGQLCTEDDEKEASWFNAGVRVGMGLGLGVCLGVGVGVGLAIRTYQAATGRFMRYLI